jgi:hypothetical protein
MERAAQLADVTCERCTRPARYRFSVPGGSAPRCPRHAIGYRPVAGRALRVALVVGTILFLINQADGVLRGDITALVVVKVGLTYLVPFAVSTYSALQINRLA